MERYEYAIDEFAPFGGSIIVGYTEANAVERDNMLRPEIAASCARAWFLVHGQGAESTYRDLLRLREAAGAAPRSPTARLADLLADVHGQLERGRLVVVPEGLADAPEALSDLVSGIADASPSAGGGGGGATPAAGVGGTKAAGGSSAIQAVAQANPELVAKHEAAVRQFLQWFLKLSDAQAAALKIEIADWTDDKGRQWHGVEGGSLNLHVSNLPDLEIKRPKSVRSFMQPKGKTKNPTDNFYVNVPKSIRPGGSARVAHIIVDDTPDPNKKGFVVLAHELRMHFDWGNPNNPLGLMTHLFGDVLLGQSATKLHPTQAIK